MKPIATYIIQNAAGIIRLTQTDGGWFQEAGKGIESIDERTAQGILNDYLQSLRDEEQILIGTPRVTK